MKRSKPNLPVVSYVGENAEFTRSFRLGRLMLFSVIQWIVYLSFRNTARRLRCFSFQTVE